MLILNALSPRDITQHIDHTIVPSTIRLSSHSMRRSHPLGARSLSLQALLRRRGCRPTCDVTREAGGLPCWSTAQRAVFPFPVPLPAVSESQALWLSGDWRRGLFVRGLFVVPNTLEKVSTELHGNVRIGTAIQDISTSL